MKISQLSLSSLQSYTPWDSSKQGSQQALLLWDQGVLFDSESCITWACFNFHISNQLARIRVQQSPSSHWLLSHLYQKVVLNAIQKSSFHFFKMSISFSCLYIYPICAVLSSSIHDNELPTSGKIIWCSIPRFDFYTWHTRTVI